MNLSKAKIVGFFSIPSLSLAEHNPTAYNAAMANAPAGAGSCSHCGNGILHHVVVQDEDGNRRFIGTTCAEKVGLDKQQVRYRMTDEQKEERDARWKAALDQSQKEQQERREKEDARLKVRMGYIGDIVTILEGTGQGFHQSLASQLKDGPLSPKQAFYAAKATSATGRRNKRNAEMWDDVEERCTWTDDELAYMETLG